MENPCFVASVAKLFLLEMTEQTEYSRLRKQMSLDRLTSKAITNYLKAIVDKARIAQQSWKNSSFAKRKLLMRTMLRYITENQETCARVAVRESGKTLLDALIGEVLVTCEKLAWLASSGEQYLVPEKRDTGRMMIMKKVRVEFIPLGVIGAIVPWNYPFHNVFNPVSAALFSGKKDFNLV